MSRVRMILALVALGAMAGAAPASAQEPSDNRFTRGVALYLAQAGQAANTEDKQKLYEQAVELAEEGLAEDATNPKLYLLIGRAYAALSRTGEAADAWDRAIEIYPEYEEELERDRQNAWIRSYNAGVTAVQQGDMAAAEEHYKQADRAFQARPEAKLNLGTLMASQGRDEEAIPYFEEALEIMNSEAGERLKERDEEAFEANRRAAVFNLAQVLARAGREEEAAEAYRVYLETSPEDITAVADLGVVLNQLGRTDEVADLYGDALEREDLTADDYFRLGIGLFGAERYDKAQTAFARSLERNPHSRNTRYNMANSIYAHARSIEDGIVAAGESAQGETREQLLELYSDLREQTDALREMDPNHEGILALAAQAARSLSDLESEPAAAELRQETADLLQARQDLVFGVDEVELAVDEGSAVVTGNVTNLKGTEGDAVTLRLTVLDAEGVEVAADDVTLTLPAVDATTRWEAELQVPDAAVPVAWRYEVVS